MQVRKYRMGGQMQGPPQQGGPQGQGAPQDVEALLEMLSQIPPEVTVGEVMKKLIQGDKPVSMPPPSPPMQ